MLELSRQDICSNLSRCTVVQALITLPEYGFSPFLTESTGADLAPIIKTNIEMSKEICMIQHSHMTGYGFYNQIDIFSFLSKTKDGGRPSTNHQMAIEMAKEICMIQRSHMCEYGFSNGLTLFQFRKKVRKAVQASNY